MALGFHHGCKAGISFGKDDMVIPETKSNLIDETNVLVKEYENQYNDGLITQGEKYNKVVDAWAKCTDKVADEMMSKIQVIEVEENSDKQKDQNSIYMMAHSGARGSPAQMKQLAGMRGLMAKPSGEIIETPITSNFKEGLSVLEYFNSTHGARKKLADTALKTANSGYLTRRLVDVAQDCIILERDCGTDNGITLRSVMDGGEIIVPISDRLLGRYLAEDIKDPSTGKVLFDKDNMIDEALSKDIEESGIDAVKVRSVLTCESKNRSLREMLRQRPCPAGNLCQRRRSSWGSRSSIYWRARNSVNNEDISHWWNCASGRPIFIESSHDGKISIQNPSLATDSNNKVVVTGRSLLVAVLDENDSERSQNKVPYGAQLFVKDGEIVKRGQRIASWDPYTRPILADVSGKVDFEDLVDGISIDERMDESTGISQRVVIDWRSSSSWK